MRMISTQFVRPCGGKKKNSLIVYDLNKKCHWLQDYASTLLGEESGRNSAKSRFMLEKVNILIVNVQDRSYQISV